MRRDRARVERENPPGSPGGFLTGVPVLVDRMYYTQESQVIDYRFDPAAGESHTLRLSISKAIPVQPGPAVAELRPGRFGMPWVGHIRQESITPQP